MLKSSPWPLRILWTLPYLPWPTSNGGRTRQHALIRQMAARGHRITLLCLSKEAPDWEGLRPLWKILDELIVIPRRPRHNPATLLAAVSSLRRPTVAAVNGCNPLYAETFARLLREGFDFVQVEHSYGFEPLSASLLKYRTPFLLTEHNVESRVVSQQYRRLPSGLRWLAKIDEMRYRRWETSVMRRAACVIAVTPQDQLEFTSRGAAATAVVPNCIDTIALSGVTPDMLSKRIVFLGNYEYAPNVDAVQRLCDHIMPLVWRLCPTAVLSVCGHAMPEVWRHRWRDKRLSFRGYVGNLLKVFEGSSVFVAPLRAGGGSKLKVLEAMASGIPVVGTAESVSGLSVRDRVHFLAAESDIQIANAVIQVLSRPEWGIQIGTEGRKYVTQHHDWTVAADALESAYAGQLRTPWDVRNSEEYLRSAV